MAAPDGATDLLRALSEGADLVVLRFPDDAALGDAPPQDAPFTDLIVRLANYALASRGVTLACVPGPIDGALLETALRCDVLAIAPEAIATFDWNSRHGPGIHSALSERIGFVAGERTLASGRFDGRALLELGVALYAPDGASFEAAIEGVTRKLPTLIPLFGASRLTFPITHETVARLHARSPASR